MWLITFWDWLFAYRVQPSVVIVIAFGAYSLGVLTMAMLIVGRRKDD